MKTRTLLGVGYAAVLAGLANSGRVEARAANYMTYSQMTTQADLIVIAMPMR
ncbi:MAG: hypothetical protein M3Y56_14445 [Armatimonadota bacterium]|nr:hypothetical protein [Armatimonadota bacterium]